MTSRPPAQRIAEHLIRRACRRLPPAASAPAWGERQPAIFPRPDGVIPAVAAVIAWAAVIGLVRALPPGPVCGVGNG